ncbi:MAG: hypothetical protein M3O70_12145 [Actinomycetota bacterium]|nr:hypothetical protein [Actinomycetota bacterium]
MPVVAWSGALRRGGFSRVCGYALSDLGGGVLYGGTGLQLAETGWAGAGGPGRIQSPYAAGDLLAMPRWRPRRPGTATATRLDELAAVAVCSDAVHSDAKHVLYQQLVAWGRWCHL